MLTFVGFLMLLAAIGWYVARTVVVASHNKDLTRYIERNTSATTTTEDKANHYAENSKDVGKETTFGALAVGLVGGDPNYRNLFAFGDTDGSGFNAKL